MKSIGYSIYSKLVYLYNLKRELLNIAFLIIIKLLTPNGVYLILDF